MILDDVSLTLLQKTKLNEKQARVYLATLQLGKAVVSEIAALADLKRPLTYVILDELIAGGYVSMVPDTKKQMYTALDPNALATELERTAHDFHDMLPYLRAQQRKAGKPYVTYYSGVEAARRAFSQIRRPKEARYALSIQKAVEKVPQEVERWKKTYLDGKARPGGKHLLTDTHEDRIYGEAIGQSEQIVRYVTPGKELAMDLALVDNWVFLTAFDKEIHVTVIESPELYRSLCLMYDLAWEAAE